MSSPRQRQQLPDSAIARATSTPVGPSPITKREGGGIGIGGIGISLVVSKRIDQYTPFGIAGNSSDNLSRAHDDFFLAPAFAVVVDGVCRIKGLAGRGGDGGGAKPEPPSGAQCFMPAPPREYQCVAPGFRLLPAPRQRHCSYLSGPHQHHEAYCMAQSVGERHDDSYVEEYESEESEDEYDDTQYGTMVSIHDTS